MSSNLEKFFSNRDDWFGGKMDEFADNFFAFVFEKLPGITIGLAIIYTAWNIIKPAIIIIK